MTELSIILVNWNAVDYLRECIASIYENTSTIRFEIIVIDNGSSIGNIEDIRAVFPRISILKSSQNLGFAKANNLGFRHSSGELVLILNPDTKLVGPAINVLIDEMKKRPDAGIMGGRHVSPDLTVQTTSIQKFPTILNQALNIEYLRRRWPQFRLWNLAPLFSGGSEPVQVEVIPGACMLLRRELFEIVGGFSEDYFMYAEDIDLNVKVAKLGFKNYYVPGATIIHYGGKSSCQQKTSQWATVMKFRAMGKFYQKNHGHRYALAYRCVMGACAVLRVVAMMAAYPVSVLARQKERVRESLDKWVAILKWALGLEQRIFNSHSKPSER